MHYISIHNQCIALALRSQRLLCQLAIAPNLHRWLITQHTLTIRHPRQFGLLCAARPTIPNVLRQRLAGPEAFVAYRTLVAKGARMVLQVIAQLNGRREGGGALGALERSLFVVHELDVLLQLVRLRVAARAEHATVRPVVGVCAAMVLLQMGFAGVRCAAFLQSEYNGIYCKIL